MNQPENEALAGRLFRALLESELSEAETVSALAIAVTMRLAYDTDNIENLLKKLEALSPIFMKYARANLHAFEAAQRAKNETPHENP